MASIRWGSNVLANLNTLDPVIRERILTKAGWLAENLKDIIPEKLHRELNGLYKLRVGDYRAIYSISQNIISIETVGHRRDVYK